MRPFNYLKNADASRCETDLSQTHDTTPGVSPGIQPQETV